MAKTGWNDKHTNAILRDLQAYRLLDASEERKANLLVAKDVYVALQKKALRIN